MICRSKAQLSHASRSRSSLSLPLALKFAVGSDSPLLCWSAALLRAGDEKPGQPTGGSQTCGLERVAG